MFYDSELKLNQLYYAGITDKNLGECFGKELIVKFTGIAFRNVNYLETGVHQLSNNQKENIRKKMTDVKLVEKKDAVLMLSQIKIFREVKEEVKSNQVSLELH